MTEEVAKILEQRKKTHGEFKHVAYVAQRLKVVAGFGDSYCLLDEPLQEGLEMILHKLARILSGDPWVNDHWDDIAGYATLVSKYISEKKNDK